MSIAQAHTMTPLEGARLTDIDIERLRADFPVLHRQVRCQPLVYLDNAATSQKPQVVIDTVNRYYAEQNANIHRGVHELSQEATELYEQSRRDIQHFINARVPCELIFVRGATEGINLVAQSYGRSRLNEGDEVLITWLEHHSNIVPWQMLCQQTGATLKVAPITDAGEVDMEAFESLLSDRTRIVAVNHVSNALGTVNPVERMTELAHQAGAVVLVDAAQSSQHVPIDVQAIGCDFLVCSGHKMFGPTGIGVLYGRAELLDAMPPYQGGGDMILSVTFEHTDYNHLPHKFEAGTPNIAGAIGLGAAVRYVADIGMARLAAYEHEVLEYGTRLLSDIDGLRLIGTAREKAGVLSFVLDAVHPHDIGQLLDADGIAIRAGHHCAQPVMERYGIPATARASIAFYNTRTELDALAASIRRAIEVFS
jgi:cysteine desulfurase/selenocysteine lyase